MSTSATAIAATPILASSLLAGSSSSTSTLDEEVSARNRQKGWDLKDDIFGDDGIVIGKGGVLGVSGLRDNDEDVGEVSFSFFFSNFFFVYMESRADMRGICSLRVGYGLGF